MINMLYYGHNKKRNVRQHVPHEVAERRHDQTVLN